MTTKPKQTLEESLREILDDNIDYGYSYKMSDYATSDEEEDDYEKEGKKEIQKAIEQLVALFKQIVEDSLLKEEIVPHVKEGVVQCSCHKGVYPERMALARNKQKEVQRKALEDIISGKEKI